MFLIPTGLFEGHHTYNKEIMNTCARGRGVAAGEGIGGGVKKMGVQKKEKKIITL